MADDDIGSWDDPDFVVPEVKVTAVAAPEVDKTLADLEAARLAAAKPSAPPKAAAKAEASGGGGGGGAFADGGKALTEAEKEELLRRQDTAAAQEMLAGLSASRCSEWAPKLVIASAKDLKDLGKAIAERVHTVRRPRRTARAPPPRPAPHAALALFSPAAPDLSLVGRRRGLLCRHV